MRRDEFAVRATPVGIWNEDIVAAMLDRD